MTFRVSCNHLSGLAEKTRNGSKRSGARGSQRAAETLSERTRMIKSGLSGDSNAVVVVRV